MELMHVHEINAINHWCRTGTKTMIVGDLRISDRWSDSSTMEMRQWCAKHCVAYTSGGIMPLSRRCSGC